MASHATLLLSLTALQQQPSPVSLSLPISLPLSDSPRQVTVKHSSANADLTVHSLVVAGQGAGLWLGDLQQQPVCVCARVRRSSSGSQEFRNSLTRSFFADM